MADQVENIDSSEYNEVFQHPLIHYLILHPFRLERGR